MRWTTMCGVLVWACGSAGAPPPERTAETTTGGDAEQVARAVPPEVSEPAIECADGPPRTAETTWVHGLRDRGRGITTAPTHRHPCFP